METETDQLWSLEDDIFNKLPEDIIHCIFRFLPSIKDVVRTSAISKSCLEAWFTFSINEFHLMDFFSGSSTHKQKEAKTEQFIRFVDSSIQRFGIQIRDGNFCNQHLSLLVPTRIRCLIPDGVLSAYWLKSLKLVGIRVCIPSSRVDLPSLTSIAIAYSDIPNEQLQKLLTGCLALEDITLIDCDSLSKVDIFCNPNLDTLRVCDIANPIDIELRPPKLKKFIYDRRNRSYKGDDPDIEIHNCPELKSLSIYNWNRTGEWFHKFIAQFPVLEELSIQWCNVLKNIRISNPLLEKIRIANCIG